MKRIKEMAIKWYKDKKLIIAFIIIVISFILGFYGKALIILKFYEPIYVITGISIFAFSWVLLFVGIFMVGWATVKRMQQQIHENVKSAAKKTYYEAKYQAQNIPRRATSLTKSIHRKTLNKVANASRSITNRIKKKK